MANPHQLLNTSWTLHRLSPLHHDDYKSLLDDPRALQTYATRLRDYLTNSLADAQGQAWREEDSALSNIGALRSCTWETLSTLSFLSPQLDTEQDDEHDDQDSAGILVALSYENITYKAALLAKNSPNQSNSAQNQKGKQTARRTRNSSSAAPSSTYLPLLLTRLPKSLRESFTTFLSANFDTYVSPLRLQSAFMCDALGRYMGSLASWQTSHEAGTGIIEDIIREMHLTLSFAPPISPSLKTLSITIPKDTVGTLLRGNPNSSSEDPEKENSMLVGLEAYLQKHLALEAGLDLPAPLSGRAGAYVRLTRVACAGFVVTGEGRMKVVAKAGEEDGNGDERNRGALRGGEVLVQAVLEKASIGE
ncbi:kinetochore complex Sim4 subunit Fta1-domain-containing protein [Aspergillus californicus]